jgi:hypothetical protein
MMALKPASKKSNPDGLPKPVHKAERAAAKAEKAEKKAQAYLNKKRQ